MFVETWHWNTYIKKNKFYVTIVEKEGDGEGYNEYRKVK